MRYPNLIGFNYDILPHDIDKPGVLLLCLCAAFYIWRSRIDAECPELTSIFDLFRFATTSYKKAWNPFAEFQPGTVLSATTSMSVKPFVLPSCTDFSLSVGSVDDAVSDSDLVDGKDNGDDRELGSNYDLDQDSRHEINEDDDSKQFFADAVDPNYHRFCLMDTRVPFDKQEVPDSLERDGVG